MKRRGCPIIERFVLSDKSPTRGTSNTSIIIVEEADERPQRRNISCHNREAKLETSIDQDLDVKVEKEEYILAPICNWDGSILVSHYFIIEVGYNVSTTVAKLTSKIWTAIVAWKWRIPNDRTYTVAWNISVIDSIFFTPALTKLQDS